jgi:hypothetical protein
MPTPKAPPRIRVAFRRALRRWPAGPGRRVAGSVAGIDPPGSAAGGRGRLLRDLTSIWARSAALASAHSSAASDKPVSGNAARSDAMTQHSSTGIPARADVDTINRIASSTSKDLRSREAASIALSSRRDQMSIPSVGFVDTEQIHSGKFAFSTDPHRPASV